tara:strand:- start:2275 stop:2649 length:375 start_codon:yes stop_codon:yes gene_type:complete
MKTLKHLKEDIQFEDIPLEERKFTIAQRIKAGQRMKRRAKIIARARQRALRKMASTETLMQRAMRSAKLNKKKQLAHGKNYADLSPGQKQMISDKLVRFLPRIKKMAKRLVKVKRQQELKRKRG